MTKTGTQIEWCGQYSLVESPDVLSFRRAPDLVQWPIVPQKRNLSVLCGDLSLRRCGCREHEAFLDETCVKCSDFHLNCPSHGTQVFSAQPLKGYTRLKNQTHAFKCLKPEIRCDAEHGDSDTWLHAILGLQYVSMQFERFLMLFMFYFTLNVWCLVWPSWGRKSSGFPCVLIHPGCCIEPMPHQ